MNVCLCGQEISPKSTITLREIDTFRKSGPTGRPGQCAAEHAEVVLGREPDCAKARMVEFRESVSACLGDETEYELCSRHDLSRLCMGCRIYRGFVWVCRIDRGFVWVVGLIEALYGCLQDLSTLSRSQDLSTFIQVAGFVDVYSGFVAGLVDVYSGCRTCRRLFRLQDLSTFIQVAGLVDVYSGCRICRRLFRLQDLSTFIQVAGLVDVYSGCRTCRRLFRLQDLSTLLGCRTYCRRLFRLQDLSTFIQVAGLVDVYSGCRTCRRLFRLQDLSTFIQVAGLVDVYSGCRTVDVYSGCRTCRRLFRLQDLSTFIQVAGLVDVYFRACRRLFRLQGLSTFIQVAGLVDVYSGCRTCRRLFRLQGLSTFIQVAGLVDVYSGCRTCRRLFRLQDLSTFIQVAGFACALSAGDFLDKQCSQRNGQVIGGKRTDEWIPYRYGRNPCELQCWTKDRSLMYSFGKVIDGTPCPASDPKEPALCVNGRCTPVDCAGYLGTDNRRDHCGVCRGDNSTCVRFHSTFWRRPRNSLNSDGRKDRHYDYNEIFRIPAGAMHVVVSEASDTNFLALADQKSNYLVNGNWRVQSPGRVLAQGSEFMYNRTWDGREQLSSEGPTTLPLTVLVLGSGDIPTVHYEYWISATNSRSLPQYPFIAKKSPESLTEYPYQTQTHHSSENTIDDSSHNHFLPPAKFQGYKSYYHRNEVLKSVPSWSIKRRKTYNKHPASRMSIPSQTDAHSEKWRNRTHDNFRHFEITVKPSFQIKETTAKTGGIHYNATTVLFSNRRSHPETTTQYIYDVRRPDGTSAFTRNNYVYPDYRDTAKRKPLDNNINVKSKNGNNSKKESNRSEPKSQEKDNTRTKRKRKSNNGDCLPCSKPKRPIKNFCQSDFVLRAIVLASERQQQGSRFELEVLRSFKNNVPILPREYIWTLDNCQCPKLRIGKEYILMGHSSTVSGKRESKLIVDKSSFVRKFTQKRARTMLRLVRDKDSVCRKFETINFRN
ncbi:a disintegrin and metalloproteinase with thrombospondin motifs 20 [Caerostris extrusa]|uniref:A disintegrin and metalloproteinase with thrombospondin motifs 20 n=1 Tax=Caerostris extrusa TaxID=172846 RepID=A0AAV4P152_CAEEX|nr:a disintegrin and metalloproteinase with thrombospondin motifs 20 [Caerostris extrusa]